MVVLESLSRSEEVWEAEAKKNHRQQEAAAPPMAPTTPKAPMAAPALWNSWPSLGRKNGKSGIVWNVVLF